MLEFNVHRYKGDLNSSKQPFVLRRYEENGDYVVQSECIDVLNYTCMKYADNGHNVVYSSAAVNELFYVKLAHLAFSNSDDHLLVCNAPDLSNWFQNLFVQVDQSHIVGFLAVSGGVRHIYCWKKSSTFQRDNFVECLVQFAKKYFTFYVQEMKEINREQLDTLMNDHANYIHRQYMKFKLPEKWSELNLTECALCITDLFPISAGRMAEAMKTRICNEVFDIVADYYQTELYKTASRVFEITVPYLQRNDERKLQNISAAQAYFATYPKTRNVTYYIVEKRRIIANNKT